jgi:filamentous hemagglutinin family protein
MNKTSAAIVRSLLLGSSALCAFSLAAHANPTGGTVQAGSATITSSGTVTTIDQKTGKVVINWDTFSIGAGSTVQFNQPGSTSIALNRVTGDAPSSIYGNLLANGNVWIINGNGILFGKGAQVNVGGLIATTADIRNQDFLNGDYSFNGATGASVVNQGTIRTQRGGYAVLSGASASNQGLIAAETGTVVIGGAKAYTVDFQGDGLLKYAITAPADNAKASNSGTIQATGGRVIMTARAASAVQDAVVNNTGMISATSAKIGQNGEVILDGGDGDVAVSGTVDVSGTAPGTTGGTVQVTGKDINVADGTTIDASGPAGGGTVEIGGNLHGQGTLQHATNVTVGKANIFVDATDSGDGGMVVVWSDNDTSFGGSVSAKGGANGGDGGMVETSGHNLSVGASATVDTTAPKGETGDWLLDPTNIYIVDGDQGTLDGNGQALVGEGPTNDLLAPSTIENALNTTDVSLQASNLIEVVGNISYSSSHTLSMLSEGNIVVLANVQNAGTGAINLVAGWDGTTTSPALFTNTGVYGNNSGTITLENDLPSAGISGHLATVGSAGGTVTLAAATIDLTSTDAPVQVGFTGAGGGDIVMRATGDILIDGRGGSTMTVGNGVPGGGGSGATTGNIDIEAGGELGIGSDSSDVLNVWVGNIAGAGSTETGNVTLVGSTIESNFAFAPVVIADLNGGNVTMGVLGDTDDGPGFVYDSSHNFTILATGNLDVASTIENDGSGAVTLVAGWDGHTLDPAALKVVGAFGNNGGVVTIGGEDASGNVFVGSASGTTTVLTGELDVDAFNGNAQLGYNGNGTGDITVRATGDVDLLGGDPSESGPFAMIGNGTVQGGVINNPVGGNIDINIGGALVLETPDGSNPGGGTDGGPSGGGGGGDCDCSWQLPPGSGGGGKPLHNDNPVTVFIGNATNGGTGTVSGSVTMIAQDLDDGSDSNGGFSAIVAADIVNGDVTLGQHGGSDSIVEVDQDFSYSSSHNLTILSAADIGIDAVIQNSGSGSITLVAGWDGITKATDLATTPNSFGNNAGTVYIGGEECDDCSYNAEIGSASGALKIYGGNVVIDGSDGYAQAGYHGAGGGDIFVTTTGDVTVTAGNDQAQIGNGSADNDVSGDIGGNITINAGGDAEFNNSEGPQAWLGNVANGDFKETGNVTLIASTAGSDNFGSILANDLGTDSTTGGNVFIGLTAGEGTFTLGGVDYNSPHTLTVASAGNISISDRVQNDGAGTINLIAGWDGRTMSVADIEANGAYGANNGTVYIGGQEFQENNVSVGTASGSTLVLTDNLNITPTGDLFGQLGYHGDGGGDIRVVAKGNVTLEAGGSGSQYAQIGNGSIEEGQVSGTVTGNIDVRAKGVLHLISDDDVGSDWIGNASDGSASGSVTIVTGNLDEGDNLNVMLGADANGGDTLFAITDANASNTIGGAIDYDSSHALSILTGGSLTIAADIQNQGTGALNIVAGWDGQTFDPAQFNTAGVYGNGTGLIAIGTGAASGSVSVGSGGDVLVAGGAVHVIAFNGDAQIGYSGASTGSIEVDAVREVNIETIVGSGGGLVAQIGNGTNGAAGTFGGAITVNAASLSMIAGDNGDIVQIGNGGANTTGSFAGDIGINVSGEVEIAAEGQNDFVQLGNGGGSGTGLAGGAITLGAGSLTLLSDTGATGSVVQVGNGGVGFTGFAEGDIAVTVTGALSVEASTGGSVFIGNLGGSDSGPDHSGNATILAGSASGLVSTIDDVLAGGDLTIGITGGDYDWNQDLTVASSHMFNLMATGSITFDSSLKNSSTGALNIVAGWDGTTTDPTLFGGDGVYGNGGGSVTIGGGSAGGNVAVGSARGEVDVYTDNLSLEADNGYAVLGYDGSIAGTSGTIGVNALDTVTLSGSDDQNVFAQIGDGQRLGDNSEAGNVGVIAGNISQSGTASVAGDEVRLTATSGDIGSGSANIAVASNSLYITTAGGDAYVTSPNMGMTLGRVDTDGGDAILSAGGPIAQTGAIIVAHLEVETTGADNAITLDNTGNAFSSLSVDSGAGASIYDSSDLSVSSASVAEGETLTLSSAGGITQTGAITADNLDVSSTGGAITLDDDDNAVNGLSVSTVGGFGADIHSNENINLQRVSVGGTLTLVTTGAIEQANAITADMLDAKAGADGITLDNDDNAVASGVTLTTVGDATFHNQGTITLFGSNVTGTLTLVSVQGAIEQQGAVTAGTLTATTTNHFITLSDTDNAIGAVNLKSGTSDAAITSNEDVVIESASVGGLGITTTGAVTQSGAINSTGGMAITAGDGGITLDSASNNVTGDVQLYTTGDATFRNQGGIMAAGTNVTGTLTLTAGEGASIEEDAGIVAGTLSLNASGPITLNDTDNNFGTLNVSSLSTSAVSITDSTAVALSDVTVGGAFTLHASGDVTQTSGLSVTGALSVTTTNDGDITLDDTANAVAGTVSLDTHGDADFHNTLATDLGSSTVWGTLTVVSGGAITQSGALSADTLDLTTTGGGNGITLTNTGNSFNTLSVSSSGDADIVDADNLSVTSAGVAEGGTLTLESGGSITQTGAITADNLDVTSGTGDTGSGDITLDDGDNAIGGLSVHTPGSHDATIYSSVSLDLQTISVGGTLTLNTTGAVTQESGISAGGLDVTAGNGGITLADDENDVSGDAAFHTTGDATFHNDTQITLGESDVTGTLTLVSGKDIGQDGAVTAGTLTATANDGGILLDDTDNAIGAVNLTTTNEGAEATVASSLSVDIQSASVGGTLTITSTGAVTQSGAIGAVGLTVSAGEGGIALDRTDNAVSGDVQFTTTGDASFHNGQQTTVGGADVGGTLTLVSGEGITQDGAIGAGTLSLTASGPITLDSEDNSFGTLDVSSKGTGAVSVTDSTAVVLDSILIGGDFTLGAGGAVTQTANALGVGGALSVSTSAGDITLDNDANAVTGTVSLNGPDDVAFSNADATTLGTSSAGGTMTITAGGAITQTGTITADTLDVLTTSGGITLDDTGNDFNTLLVTTNGTDNATIVDSTDLTIQSAGVGGTLSVTASGIGQSGAINAQALSVDASGGITLDNENNSFASLSVSTDGGDATVNDKTGVDIASAALGTTGTFTLSAGGAITQSGVIGADEVDVSTTAGAITLDNTGNAFANVDVSTQGADGATIVDSGPLNVTGATVGGTLWLTADRIDQSGSIQANALGLIATNGVTLVDGDNKFSGLEVTTTNSDASIADAWGIDIYSAGTGTGTLTLNSGGHVTQEADSSIVAGGLSVTAGEGGITLDQANDVSGDVSFSTDGDATFRNTQQITLGGGDVGGTLTLNSDAGIGQDGAFTAATLTATAGEGTITLTNGENVIGTVNLSTTSGSDVSVTSSSGLTLGQIIVGGRLVVMGSEVDQNQALVLTHGIKVTSTDGDIALGNAGNAVSGVVQLSSAGDATFANTLTTQIGTSSSAGTMTLLSKGDIDVVGVVQNTSGNIVVVAGWDGTTTNADDYGNSGVYGNGTGSLVIGGAGVANFAGLGAQSGTTTVYAYNVNVLGQNAGAQLGYHGTGGGDISVVARNDVNVTAGSGNAFIGNGSLGTDVEGNVTGDIDLRVANDATFTNSTNKITWFGNRTSGGNETGDVTLIAGSIDGENGADIGGMVTTDIVGGDVTIGGTSIEDGSIDNSKTYTYSSSHTLDLLTAGSLTIEGSIQNTGSGAINIVAGWDGHTLSGFDAAGVAGNNGKGVVIGGQGASGGVAIGSAGGPTSVYGAFLTLGAVNGYAQLGFHGGGLGAILVDVSGNVVLNGGGATSDYAQIGNGGQGTGGNNGGDIAITAGGEVVLTGGAGTEAYAQIGHGGAESNSNSAGYSNTGDIVIGATNVTVDAGSGSGAYAQIGHGGLKAGQGLTGEGDNTGDITVAVTHAVTLLGSGPDGYAQIGNGGSQSNLGPSAAASGTDSGVVSVVAPNGADGSVTLTAGAGANAYAQIGNGGYSVNAGANAVAGNFSVAGDITVTDLAMTGNGANGYAVIGNGDVTQTSYGNVLGDITIDANGNITYTNGTGTHSTATIGNFTGHGTTSGTIDGATPPTNGGGGNPNGNTATVGTIVATQANNNRPDGNNPITVINTVVITVQGENSGGATGLTVHIEPSTPGPLASLDSKSADSEPPTSADSATVVIADSLDGAKQGNVNRTMVGGLLTQNNAPTGTHAVHAIPPADQDFSSWGNEALWQ